MAKRALRSKEEIAAVPVDQPVELDLSPADDPIVVVEKDEPQPKPEPRPKVTVQDPPADEPSERETSLQKQLDDLKKAEATRASELERQLAEARKQAQEFEARSAEHQTGELEAQYDSVLNAIGAAESEAQAAENALAQAAERGDYKAQAEAQRKLSRAEASLLNLEQGKSALEAKRESIKNTPVIKKDLNADPFENAIAALPEPAKVWLRGHREFMTDARKNAKIQSLHWEAQDAGHAAYSPGYFEFIEVGTGLRRAPAVEDDDDQPEPRRAPVSAPVSRDPPSPTTGRTTPQRVTLTAEERDIARSSMPNTDPGEAERIYAQNKLKLQQLKRDGFYKDN
jgi:hypothetical protein